MLTWTTEWMLSPDDQVMGISIARIKTTYKEKNYAIFVSFFDDDTCDWELFEDMKHIEKKTMVSCDKPKEDFIVDLAQNCEALVVSPMDYLTHSCS